MQPSRDIHRLIEIMAALRDPERGCPWDVEQSFASIIPYTIEEAYEVADAIERGDAEDLREELGDLLLQVVFHARMAEEAGLFDFGGVVEAITAKLIRRHPHVFGDARELDTEAVKALWGRIKADEKRARAEARRSAGVRAEAAPGALGGVPLSLPALSRALKLQEKAGKVGFDWDDVRGVVAKLAGGSRGGRGGDRRALCGKSCRTRSATFCSPRLTSPVTSTSTPRRRLRGANSKFERRFAHIEQRLAESGRKPEGADLDEMEALWLEAKGLERQQR